ncbi:unnamed protein product [Protopolystoma xenopodis]|uniref:Myotubularin phosphatase domain-containing protein n=1 Tax=Protopolystoma xenopodis TaxID=117903 RepID=A0A3S5BNY8_9PLAT|nr:unnamed protein product [Protopolystoma xenopodis]
MELSSLIKVSSIKDVFLYGPESLVIRGYLLLSAHHLLISADDEEFWIQLKNIDHIRILEPNERWYHSAHTKGYIVALYTKNFLIFEITILNMEDATNLVRSVELLSGVDDTYLLFPFHFRSEFDITEDGWNIFSMAEEFAPLLVSGEWRISRVNWDFSVCRSYPREVIVPTRITDDILIEAAKFRRGGRFPIVAYYHSPKRTVLLIAGEPLASTNSTFYLQQPGNFTQISQPAWLETNQPSTPPGSGPRQSLAQSTQKALLLSSSAQCPSDSSFSPTTNAASALVSSQSPTSAKSGGLEVIRSFSALSALANFNSTFTLTSDSVATEPIKPSELTEEIPDTEQKKAPSFSSSSGLGINSAYASTSPQIIGGINMAGETRCRADEQILNACLASTTVMLQNYQEQQDHGQRQRQSSTQDPSTSNRSALSDAQSSMGLCRGAILDVRSQSELKRVPASGMSMLISLSCLCLDSI